MVILTALQVEEWANYGGGSTLEMVDLTAGTIRVSESVFHGQVQLPRAS